MASRERESKRSGKLRLTSTADEFSQGTSRTPSDSATSESAVEGPVKMAATQTQPQLNRLASESTCRPLTSSAEDSPAKTFRKRKPAMNAPKLTESVLDFGRKCGESLANYDRESSSWKTSQLCFSGDLAEFSATWSNSGTMRSGKAFQRQPLVRLTSESAFLYLPTPQASDSYFEKEKDCNALVLFRKETTGTRPSGAKIGSSLRWSREFVQEQMRTGGVLNPQWYEVLMGYPIGWTESEDAEIALSRKSQSGLEGE